MKKSKIVLGIDIGGSGIKGAPVNIKTGKLLESRIRIPTPAVATPEAVAEVVKQIVMQFKWEGMVGCGFPAVVKNGIINTAANIDKAWINVDAFSLFHNATGVPVYVVNDADAAGYAVMKFGKGKNVKGTVIVLTVGTGIGSAIFTKGKILRNTELGHLYMPNGKIAEHYASDAVRKDEGLEWDVWSERFNEYINHLERLFSPDLFVIGGGASKKKGKFFEYLNTETRLVASRMQNDAGIIGAAVAAYDNRKIFKISYSA